jgi:hypothetical protein
MNFIRDVISYEADVTTRGTDLISQCDPSFKE